MARVVSVSLEAAAVHVGRGGRRVIRTAGSQRHPHFLGGGDIPVGHRAVGLVP